MTLENQVLFRPYLPQSSASRDRQGVCPTCLRSSGSVFRWSLFAVALIEAIDASRSIDQLLLAGEKRMTSRADFNVQIAFFGRARLKGFAAGAGNRDLAIFRVNLWFHYSLDPHYRQLNATFSNKP
jgi:hypothetical protein